MLSNSAISPEISLNQGKPIDANRYATKKTIAQGMLDIALLTANASQLKYILQVGEKHEFYSLMVGLITTSIILQICVGILFLIIGGLDINLPCDHQPANIMNDVVGGLTSILMVRLNLNNAANNKLIPNLNHAVLSCVTLNMIVSILKMSFGLDPALPSNSD